MADQDREAAWAARMDTWWANWWAADYSWDGLAKKDWRGWVRPADNGPCVPAMDGVAGKPAVLQDYFKDRLGSDLTLITSPDGTRHFTRLHLPLTWPDGTPTAKANWPGDALDGDLRLLFAAGEGPRKEEGKSGRGPDRRAQCDGVVFQAVDLIAMLPDATRDKDGRIPLSLSCENAAFTGDARFNKAAFCGEAGFDNAAFSGDARFHAADFQGSASFSGAAFSGLASFHEAAFQSADFDKAAFFGDAGFYKATFQRYASFSSAAFSGTASFHEAAFSGWVWFYNVAFSGDASFESASFFDLAVFEHAAFSGDASFYHAAFCQGLFLNCAHFEGKASFKGKAMAFSRPSAVLALEFNQAPTGATNEVGQGQIVMPAELLPAAYRSVDSIWAENAVFVGDVDFGDRDIMAESSFTGVTFLGLAKFHGAQLHQWVDLPKEAFRALDYALVKPGQNRVGPLRRQGEANQHKSRWLPAGLLPTDKRAWPTASLRLLEADLRTGGDIWRKLAVARDEQEVTRVRAEPVILDALGAADWKIAVRAWTARVQTLREEGVVPANDARYIQIEACFRTLKQAMEGSRARLAESDFFKLELKARRRRKNRDWWEKAFSDFYGAMSDYGASALRPVIWLAGALVGFAALYWLDIWAGRSFVLTPPSNFQPGQWWIDPDVWNAVRFSASRMLPFGALAEEDWAWPKMLLSDTWGGGTARMLATLQSLLAAVLTFQIALAVRRRFQIT